MIPELFWFNAFRASTPQELMEFLKNGLHVPPGETRTKRCEKALNISPACVYFYLGRTNQAFGQCLAITRDFPSDEAMLSPFDSGGLINHYPAIRDWGDEKKANFLRSYSWNISQKQALLKKYPGEENIVNYLSTNWEVPHSGPNGVWSDKPEGNVWIESKNDWQCRIWESRWPGHFPFDETLVAWSCPTTWAPDVGDLLENIAQSEPNWAMDIQSKYEPSGISLLIDKYVEMQKP